MDARNSIPTILQATATALGALPLAPGQPTRLQAHQPALGWLEACCERYALAGNAAGVARMCRVWVRAWTEAADI